MSLPGDRFNYNKALAQSSNEQLLLNIVRLRYGEPLHWLEVSSMLSQYTFQADARAGAWWNDLNVWSNPALRALAGVDGDPSEQTSVEGGVQYSDRPTISYAPVQGEDFSRRLLSPVPLTAVMYFVQAGWPVDMVFQCCVSRINGISNTFSAPLHDKHTEQTGDSAFDEILALLRQRQDRGELQWTMEAVDDENSVYLLAEGSESESEEVTPLRELLGVSRDAKQVLLTNRASPREDNEVAVRTRSLLGTMQTFTRFVDVPLLHARRQMNLRLPDVELSKAWLTIKHSPRPRPEAFVQVRHEGYWFYIDKSDFRSKRTFAFLTYLYSLQSTDMSGKGPLITVPANR